MKEKKRLDGSNDLLSGGAAVNSGVGRQITPAGERRRAQEVVEAQTDSSLILCLILYRI